MDAQRCSQVDRQGRGRPGLLASPPAGGGGDVSMAAAPSLTAGIRLYSLIREAVKNVQMDGR